MIFFECPPQIYRFMVKLRHICAYLQICYKTKLLQKEERNFIQRNKTKMSTINKKQKIWNKNAQNAHKSRQILNSRPTEKCMLRQKIFVHFENFRLRNEWTAKGSESRKKVWLSMVRTTSPSVWYLQRQILKLSMVGYLHNKDPSKKVGQKVHGFNPSTPTYHRHHQWQWSSHHHHPRYCHQGLPTHSIIIIVFVNNRNAK